MLRRDSLEVAPSNDELNAPTVVIDAGEQAAFPWSTLVDKVSQTALFLVLAKLLSAWALVAFWGVGLHNRMVWGVIPYAGLSTSGAQFRTVAAWSSTMVAVAAVLWMVGHFVRRDRHHAAWVWSAAAAVPMAGLLAAFEWFRRFDADHLIPTHFFVRIAIFLTVAAVLFLGFIEYPGDEQPALRKNERRTALPKISAQP